MEKFYAPSSLDRFRDRMGPTAFLTFLRSQMASIVATTVDFLLVIFLTAFWQLWYVISNMIGASTGALTSFLLGRYWVFESFERKIEHQAFRYLLVAFGSLLLNTAGVYLLTEYLGIHYAYSKVVVALCIGIGFNFVLHKYFVFRKV